MNSNRNSQLSQICIVQWPKGEKEAALRAQGVEPIAGVDEVGAGALAGPVVAAAVVLPLGHALRVRDSKTLSALQRERLCGEIRAVALGIGVGICDATEIDRVGIRAATHAAMRAALAELTASGVVVAHVLVDGWRIPELNVPQTAIVKGDASEYCIAAASIVAKVTRDRMMVAFDACFPAYAFARHKGYGTQAHRDAVRVHGPCELHRQSFSCT